MLATNFVSCSAVKLNVSFEVLGIPFLVVDHMLPKCLFLYSGHPLYDATCDPLQLAHLGFLASLFGHPL